MVRIGVQSKNIVIDTAPDYGFRMIRDAGFSCVDFSLNSYLKNQNIYKEQINDFFDKTIVEMENFFEVHKNAAIESNIAIHQMHMPYPIYVPYATDQINHYLMDNVAVKSIKICSFMNCKNLVIHGFKLAETLGSEQAEWDKTQKFLMSLAPIAKENNVVLCVEN